MKSRFASRLIPSAFHIRKCGWGPIDLASAIFMAVAIWSERNLGGAVLAGGTFFFIRSALLAAEQAPLTIHPTTGHHDSHQTVRQPPKHEPSPGHRKPSLREPARCVRRGRADFVFRAAKP